MNRMKFRITKNVSKVYFLNLSVILYLPNFLKLDLSFYYYIRSVARRSVELREKYKHKHKEEMKALMLICFLHIQLKNMHNKDY